MSKREGGERERERERARGSAHLVLLLLLHLERILGTSPFARWQHSHGTSMEGGGMGQSEGEAPRASDQWRRRRIKGMSKEESCVVPMPNIGI